MNLPEKFTKKLYEDVNLNAQFILKNQQLANDFKQLIMNSNYKTILNYLKLKLLLILENETSHCDFDIEYIFKKIPENDFIHLHLVLMYSLLIQTDLVDCVKRFLNKSIQNLINENNTLYNLQILHTILEACYLRQLHIIKIYDEDDKLFNLIIKLTCNEDKHTRNKVLLDVIPNYINCTNKHELFLQIWLKVKGTLVETSIVIYLEKYYFSNISTSQFKILNETNFWTNLQNRISDTSNPAVRKEAMYLLNKSLDILFNTNYLKNDLCDLEILKCRTETFNECKVAWENFYSLCEVSNEKQLHLIEPTFKLMDTIKMLHVSWQNCISKLLIRHPHNAVVKYTINKALNSEWNCDMDELVTGLNHVYLYTIENKSIFNSLENYIRNLSDSALSDFLNKICITRPSPVPFYFICKSVKIYKFKKVNYKMILDLLTYSVELPHLYIRKGVQNCIFDIFLNMHEHVPSCANDHIIIEDDFMKIVMEFYDIGYLGGQNKFKTHQLKLLIQTKFDKFKYELNENLLLSPKYFSVFIAFLTDQEIIHVNWMQLNIIKLWSLLKDTECNNTKLKYMLFVCNIEKTRCELNKSNQIRFSNDDVNNFFTELSKICQCPNININNDEFVNNVVFIFDVLVDHKKNDPDFCKSCIDILEILRNVQKHVLFITLLEKLIITLNIHNILYLNTVLPYLKDVMKNNKSELKSIYSKYVRLNLENLLYIHKSNEGEKEAAIIEIISEYYCIGGNDIILLVIDALSNIVTNTKSNEMNLNFCSQLINLLIRLDADIFNYRANEIFRPAIAKFIKLIMNSNMPNNNDQVKSFVDSFCLKIFEPDQTISGLRNKILENSTVELSLQILVEALLYCPILRKDQKIEFDTCNLISKDFEKNTYCNEENYYEIDIRVTSLAISILLNRIAKHEIETYKILFLLQQKYMLCAGKRYYGDSQLHITKLRILQALHLIIDYLNKSDNEQLNKWMYDCLVHESQQPSIKILIQWLLIRTYEKMENLPNIICNLITNSKHLTGTSITSIFPILYHLLKLQNKNISEDTYSQCFKFLLPFTMRPQFNIRYMAQLTLKNIYEIIDEPEIKSRYSIIYEAVLDVINQTVSEKTIDNVLTFEHLPFTIETIYYEIPRLTNVSHTKWIPVEYFNVLPLIVLKSECSLKHLQPKTIVAKDVQSSSDGENINMNVQKKIDTISMNSFIEDVDIKTSNGNLIVVASLIDRAPNLGGLSRTCEVFGVKQYVLNNLQFMKNKEYQSLSMSSEKWVHTIEVKIENLSNYLIEMKGQGYKVVGAEQTADSKKLGTFQFEENIVLLLGNEKEGIPANLICLLDECIEIPQFGQIRSLNVHVAAALFIWEYAKQYS